MSFKDLSTLDPVFLFVILVSIIIWLMVIMR